MSKKAKPKSEKPADAQIADVKEIEGVGPKYSRKLKAAGIRTTEDLRLNALVEIVENTNLSPKLLYKWQCMADLFRMKRVAEEYSDLLYYAGVETVKEVSKQKADELQNLVERTAKKMKRKKGWAGDIKKIPGESEVKKWIDSAKELVKKTEKDSIAHLEAKAKVVSKEPAKGQVGDVIDIEGIGPETKKDLNAVGIKTTEELRLEPLVEIVEATGLSPKRVYRWQCLADLFRVPDLAEEYSDLLMYSGIQTVKELSRQKVRPLYNKVRRMAAKAKEEEGWAGDVKKLPSEKTVKTWINEAKDIVKKPK
jgi:predicted flap endonuclease-1-like 5' DNA nuclease